MTIGAITSEFDAVRNGGPISDMTVEEAIDAFLSQTGFSRIEEKHIPTFEARMMLHEMAHVLADAVGEGNDKGITISKESEALVLESALLGQSGTKPIGEDIEIYMTEDGKCPTPEEPLSVEEIRLIVQEFQTRHKAELDEEMRYLKAKIFNEVVDFSKIAVIPDTLENWRKTPWRSSLWDEAWLDLLPYDQRIAVDEAFARESKIAEYGRGLNEKELSEPEFLQAISRAKAIKAYFISQTGREITDVPYPELMQMPIVTFGVMPRQDGEKVRFVPFIPIGDEVRCGINTSLVTNDHHSPVCFVFT